MIAPEKDNISMQMGSMIPLTIRLMDLSLGGFCDGVISP